MTKRVKAGEHSEKVPNNLIIYRSFREIRAQKPKQGNLKEGKPGRWSTSSGHNWRH